ncbi:UDP-glucose flavonoid 3-O-glucosyltransferase 6 [Morus notabilis]|uniref:Glycosyltransferase n=1 Tax=Morus notabilis TaxID=981085 RepID=W9SEP3_9ROSA|nr:UDP-glycosyltransferase 43 [Morus notabilis]XP_010105323.1 UDP-glycosyltransferase 43 [Morus notabilis]EXB75128.1 UDP-glucose flavonoid 3-O-glucosyltransferase 6 [Morus notabilis]EXC50818.1 UDP-glucose flavonoid 3-O-glucosyltransferase 6 [Morus notabilis]
MAGKSHSHDHEHQKEVVFISTPAIGMLTPTVEFARRLVHRNPDRLSATVLLIPVPHWPTIHSYTQSLPATSSPNLRFLLLPTLHPPSPDNFHSYVAHLSSLVDQHKPSVKQAISELLVSESKRQVVGLFVDMFCTSMIDVADDLGLPSYLFFASPASFLSFMLDIPILDSQLASDSVAELSVRGFANSVPRRVLPTTVLKRGDEYSWCLRHARRYKETKGIIVNSLRELEPVVLHSLSVSGIPKVYLVGPIVDLSGPAQWHPDRAQYETVMRWLDNQPSSSVLFLCFGSLGSLSGPQVKELALGIERSGFRFVWSCRGSPKSKLGLPSEYTNFDEVLPNGFLERTAGMGLVCGWVPQVTILAHRAVGGFVSHCGWNSILESLWHGVPIATWPIYAEQQMNAFEMVKELGLAVEITLDYREGSDLVSAEEVERGITRLMESDGEVRAKVKSMREKCRMALVQDGSSHESLGALVVCPIITPKTTY